MLKLEDIISSLHSYNPSADTEMIWKAYLYAAKVHRGQTRMSGEPYLSHPLEVAFILTKLKMDVVTIASGILHDIIEDTHSTPKEIKEAFGEEVLSIVDGVTKISKITFTSREEKQAENFRKMIIAMANDIRVVIVKLADRLHNIRTLEFMPRNKQISIARETMDIYAQIANRLGIGWMKTELEDGSFRYLDPESFKYIQDKVQENYETRQSYIEMIQKDICEELRKAGIEVEIKGRPKHIYSIYNKMNTRGFTFEQLYDLLGLRVLTKNIKDCYAVLGIVHSKWKPVPGKIKDYIAMPKANMYQSLHTSVVTKEGKYVEFQIRTEEMHKIAEEGIAAHWKYKEGKSSVEVGKDDKWMAWLKHLLEWQKDLKNPKEFLDTMRRDLSVPYEVYVFTPKGEVKSFPAGSCMIDFAYGVHTDIGNKCVGAKVNGRIVPLKYQFKNGEMIEIITSGSHVPNKDWLKIVKTSKAKNRIRNWIREEQKGRSILLGKEMLEKELQRYDIKGVAPDSANYDIQHLSKEMGFLSLDNFYANIGFGNISLQQLISKIVPNDILEKKKKSETSKFQKIVDIVSRKAPLPKGNGIKVKGVDNILTRFGKCCNPIPGDEIIGFITRGRGISVHTKECPSVSELVLYDTERFLNVEWDSETSASHKVKISIVTVDKPGILATISNAISSCGVNISSATVNTTDKKAYFEISLDIKDLEHLNKVMTEIKKVKGVVSVIRLKEGYIKKTEKKKEKKAVNKEG